MAHGELCAMISGEMKMQVSFANNWGSQNMVNHQPCVPGLAFQCSTQTSKRCCLSACNIEKLGLACEAVHHCIRVAVVILLHSYEYTSCRCSCCSRSLY